MEFEYGALKLANRAVSKPRMKANRIFQWLSCAMPLLACSVESVVQEQDRARQAITTAVEAETLLTSGSVVRSYTDRAASGGKALRFYTNGSLTTSVASSTARVSVRARAALCDGAPNLDVYVAGTRVASLPVDTTSYRDFQIDLSASSSAREFVLRYANDASSGTCDRDLIVDTLTFNDAPPSTNVNPFAGEKLYVDPASAARNTVNAWRAAGRGGDADYLEKIAGSAKPVRYFAEWTETPESQGVELQVSHYVRLVRQAGALPVMGTYALPHRDCGNYSKGGFATAESYRAWIEGYARAIGDAKVVVLLEPDALAGMNCLPNAADQLERVSLIAFAVRTLKSKPNTYVYIDAGHSKWRTAELMSARLKEAGVEHADGFVTNNANFNFTSEEIAWGERVSAAIAGKHFIIDTSRNGRGPYTQMHDGDCEPWANPPGRALGALPTANTGHPLVDAFYWLKTPGASDGDCGPFPAAGTWMPEYALGLCKETPAP